MRFRILATISVLALLFVGCSSSDSADDSSGTTVASNKPDVEVPEGKAPETLEIEDLEEGDGEEVVAGSYVELRYVGVLHDTGEEFSSRWDGDTFKLVLGRNVGLPGLEEGLQGMKVGGQRRIIIPADEAYGEVERQGIPSNSTLVFLVEVDQTFAEPAGDEIANIDEPIAELEVEVLEEGDGETVEEGADVVVNYIGISQSSGEEFDSSWGRGEPATFNLGQVIPGWGEGMAGQKVGSRVRLVIPGEKAYGETPPSPDIGANDTLIFVVDILDSSVPAIQVPTDPAVPPGGEEPATEGSGG